MKNRPLTDNQDGTFAVPLTRGLTATVDAKDAARVGLYNWSAWVSQDGTQACAVSKIGSRVVKMHRWLLGVSDPKTHVDHRNMNALDNRRCNLRVATHAENQRNKSVRRDSRSGVKGVSFHAQAGKWTAKVKRGNKSHYLGLFDSVEDAAAAYAKAAKAAHGKFARTDNAEPMPSPQAPRRPRTGVKGVSVSRGGRYEAHIRADGRLLYLGTFDTIAEASSAVRAKERELDMAV